MATNNSDASGPTGDFSAAWVKEAYHWGLKDTLENRKNFWLNNSFVRGYQWVFWNNQNRQVQNVARNEERVQATINRLAPAERTIIGKVISRELVFDVAPTAADDATEIASRTSESIVQDTADNHDWEAKREMWALAAWQGGTGAIAVDWDPKAGRQVDEGVYEGDTVETVLNIAEFVVEPGSKNPEKARWWIKALALPPREVQAMYHMAEIPPADATVGESAYNQRMFQSEMIPLTLVLTYYERPNYLCPQGRIAVVINGDIVGGASKPWPFPFKDHLNIAVGKETPVHGKWAGETVLTQARPVQTALNAAYSSIIEHMKLAGNARLMLPMSSVDLIETMSDLPSEVLPYADQSAIPSYLSPPVMPDWWRTQPQQLEQEIADILGSHDISMGEAPGRVESGYGLSILAENENTPVYRLTKQMASVFSKVATMCLELFADNVTEQRKAIISGNSQAPETIYWTGKDLMGQTHAKVPVDAVQHRSRAGMQQMADNLVSMGLVNSIAQYAALVEMPQQENMIDLINPDVSKARREDHRMALGEVCVPAPFDDHDAHIKQHNNFRKTSRYESSSDATRKVIDDHVQAHETLAAEAMGRQAAKAQIAPPLASVPTANGAPTIPVDAMAAPEQGPLTQQDPMAGMQMPPPGPAAAMGAPPPM